MMKREFTLQQLTDLFVRARSAIRNSLIEEIEDLSFLGPDDEWLFIELKKKLENLSQSQFVDFIESIAELVQKKYGGMTIYLGDLLFGVVCEVIDLRQVNFNTEEKHRLRALFLRIKNIMVEKERHTPMEICHVDNVISRYN